MHKYKLKTEESKIMDEPMAVGEYQRRITIPADDKILKELEIGQEVEVRLVGKIESLHSHRSDDYTDKSVGIVVEEVCVCSDDDSFKEGFEKSKPKRLS